MASEGLAVGAQRAALLKRKETAMEVEPDGA